MATEGTWSRRDKRTTFTLIVPTILETELTGFVGAVEKTYRKQLYRLEIWPAGWALFKDGNKLRSWDDLPAAVQKAAKAGRDVLQQAQKMKGGS